MLSPEFPTPELNSEQIRRVLLSVAARRAYEKGCTHPGDMSAAMSEAMESAAETLTELRDLGYLGWAS